MNLFFRDQIHHESLTTISVRKHLFETVVQLTLLFVQHEYNIPI